MEQYIAFVSCHPCSSANLCLVENHWLLAWYKFLFCFWNYFVDLFLSPLISIFATHFMDVSNSFSSSPISPFVIVSVFNFSSKTYHFLTVGRWPLDIILCCMLSRLSVYLSALFIATTPYWMDGTDGKRWRALGAKPVIKLSEIDRRCQESVLLTLAQLVGRLSSGTAMSAAAYVQ